mgnify:CR=1 FL=1
MSHHLARSARYTQLDCYVIGIAPCSGIRCTVIGRQSVGPIPWLSLLVILLTTVATGCGSTLPGGAAQVRGTVELMATLDPAVTGHLSNGPPPEVCPLRAYSPGCHASLNGLIVPTGPPGSRSFMTISDGAWVGI